LAVVVGSSLVVVVGSSLAVVVGSSLAVVVGSSLVLDQTMPSVALAYSWSEELGPPAERRALEAFVHGTVATFHPNEKLLLAPQPWQ
jgi:hypothetical protein